MAKEPDEFDVWVSKDDLPLLSIDEQIAQLKEKGVTFDLCIEEEAKAYLADRTYYRGRGKRRRGRLRGRGDRDQRFRRPGPGQDRRLPPRANIQDEEPAAQADRHPDVPAHGARDQGNGQEPVGGRHAEAQGQDGRILGAAFRQRRRSLVAAFFDDGD